MGDVERPSAHELEGLDEGRDRLAALLLSRRGLRRRQSVDVGDDARGKPVEMPVVFGEPGFSVRGGPEGFAGHRHAVAPGLGSGGLSGPERCGDSVLGDPVGVTREIDDELGALGAEGLRRAPNRDRPQHLNLERSS